MPQNRVNHAAYMKRWRRARRQPTVGEQPVAVGGEHRNVNPIEREREPFVSRREVFMDATLPTRQANIRFLQDTSRLTTPWSKLVILTGEHQVVNPTTGEVLGNLDRLDRLEAIVGIMEERIAALSYKIADMEADNVLMMGTEAEEVREAWKN